jgi:hypothetical protein
VKEVQKTAVLNELAMITVPPEETSNYDQKSADQTEHKGQDFAK